MPPVATIRYSPLRKPTSISTAPGDTQASALSGPANSSEDGSTRTRTSRPPSEAR